MVVKDVSPEQTFEPVTIQVTLETQMEFSSFEHMALLNDTVPRVVAGACSRSATFNRDTLHDILYGIANALPRRQ